MEKEQLAAIEEAIKGYDQSALVWATFASNDGRLAFYRELSRYTSELKPLQLVLKTGEIWELYLNTGSPNLPDGLDWKYIPFNLEALEVLNPVVMNNKFPVSTVLPV